MPTGHQTTGEVPAPARTGSLFLRTRCNSNQAIGTFLDGLVRVLVVDDIVQHHTAIAVGSCINFLTCTQ